ncbi:MAG TPA: Holliday junction resolvase RuvX [Sporichthyaceae bacterium]|jgi:putative Holliday junction resolvase|nr:Holliday junction resolvase RuvX [Sporichthyaceae bacterium]
MRPGVRVGLDLGTVRIGVAASDPSGSLAVPVETLRRDAHAFDRIAALLAEREAVEVVVGLPRSLSGADGPAAVAARTWAAGLARRLDPVPVRLVDERLSTTAAARGLREAGVSGRKARGVVDQVAAAVFLQAAMDAERSTGTPPGEAVPPDAGDIS